MKIERRGLNGVSGAQRADLSRPGAPTEQTTEPIGVQPSDQLSLSAKTLQVSGLQPALEAMPALRAELVQQLKERIARGEYRVHPHHLAGRLLKAGVIDA